MRDTLDIPWHRYALIAELAKRLQGVSPQFGKTALQKLVYFLQEVYGLGCGYDFQMYSYGPYAPQLLGDLDVVEHLGWVSVDSVRAVRGYAILPTRKSGELHAKAARFLDDPKTSTALDSLVHTFGSLTAKELELRATIVFVERDLTRKHGRANIGEICRIVGEIKPKFSSTQIRDAVRELKEAGSIQLAV